MLRCRQVDHFVLGRLIYVVTWQNVVELQDHASCPSPSLLLCVCVCVCVFVKMNGCLQSSGVGFWLISCAQSISSHPNCFSLAQHSLHTKAKRILAEL